MNGPANLSSVNNVRVFFRLFPLAKIDTDYGTSTTYPYIADAAGQPESPLLGAGVIGQDDVPSCASIPFFATGNYSDIANEDFRANVDYTADSVNNRSIDIGAGTGVWAYYGCYLNLYANLNLLPTPNPGRILHHVARDPMSP